MFTDLTVFAFVAPVFFVGGFAACWFTKETVLDLFFTAKDRASKVADAAAGR